MHIAIFGASGLTGRLLTERALAQGHTVAALVRRPAEFPPRGNPNLTVLEGSPFDPGAVSNTLARADAVFSALGAHSPFRKEDVLERAVPVIIAAMQATLATPQPTRRIIVLGSAGALPSSLDKQPVWRRSIIQNIIYKFFLKYPNASQASQHRDLAASNLDWTMAMPPMLTNRPARGRYRIDPDALPRNGSSISRADVADFMLAQLTNPQWIRRGVYLSD